MRGKENSLELSRGQSDEDGKYQQQQYQQQYINITKRKGLEDFIYT